jgi:hypothetical protein
VNRPAAGFGCLVTFLLPFAAVGGFTAVQCVRFASQGKWSEAGFFAIFALTFGGVGFGGIAAALAGRRKLAEIEALRQKNPAAPWLWRPDWAAGRVDDSSRATMWTAWAFAALWNLISIPSAVLGVRAALREDKPAGYVALLFPLGGIGLLVRAVRATIRYRRFGISRFELTTRPGIVGHSLAGTVRTTITLRPAEGVQVALRCVRRVTSGTGDNRSTSESTLWEEEIRVQGQVSRDASGMGTTIPVAFAIPADATACDDRDSDNRVLWRLEVSASVPGVDYAASFEVPVFRTELSDHPPTPAEAALKVTVDVATYHQPVGSRIEVRTSRRGTEILFPAARNPGAALGLTVFVLLWSVAVWFLIHYRAPVIFPIVFGAFELLLLLFVLELWLRVSRVVAGDGSLSIGTGYLIPGGERSWVASEIDDVTTRITMQAGGRPYYDVVAVTKNGKKVTAGHSVRDKHEAEWLAATIKRALRP